MNELLNKFLLADFFYKLLKDLFIFYKKFFSKLVLKMMLTNMLLFFGIILLWRMINMFVENLYIISTQIKKVRAHKNAYK